MSNFEIYGCEPTGDETSLELSKMARIQYLKTKMRKKLLVTIGDEDDNIADLTRACVLGLAIQNEQVTNADLITRYGNYVSAMLAGYGGAESIMSVLESNLEGINALVVSGYYASKQQIMECEDEASVNNVDLPWEPVAEMED